jgi:AraC family transcriptional regulator of adaptative response/methylated-DNA-[protein]-cysteine methyltransferase
MTLWTNNSEELWQAVTSRDNRFDGSFVFAVSSTGIYCRPSCPSRRPRRERVSFYRLPEAAEQAGFRACRRCHPQRAVAPDPQVEVVRNVCRLIDEREDEHVDLATLAVHAGLSAFHLQRTFKSVMGITPRQYAEARRTSRFKAGVRRGESVTNAMYDAGYGSSSRLYERATAELGMTPATYSRGGRGALISHSIVQSPLGRLLVAATEKGICAVTLGDSDTALETDLRSEFPAAHIERNDGPLTEWVGEILDHLAGKRPRVDLPLDIQATAFQRRVWAELRAIPYGSTRSYGEVAAAIGRPTAVRAIARACATNPVALVIPCHRVIREDQSLGGYRWGLERKKKLLARERLGQAIATTASDPK